MKNEHLKKLSRVELLRLLIEQMKENETLLQEKKQLTKQLEDRTLVVQNCGSLAEAALEVNGVFAAAEAAAKQYLENLRNLSGEADRTLEEAKQVAHSMLLEAQSDSAQLIAEARLEAERILSSAHKEARQIKAAAMETWESFIDCDGKR